METVRPCGGAGRNAGDNVGRRNRIELADSNGKDLLCRM